MFSVKTGVMLEVERKKISATILLKQYSFDIKFNVANGVALNKYIIEETQILFVFLLMNFILIKGKAAQEKLVGDMFCSIDYIILER